MFHTCYGSSPLAQFRQQTVRMKSMHVGCNLERPANPCSWRCEASEARNVRNGTDQKRVVESGHLATWRWNTDAAFKVSVAGEILEHSTMRNLIENLFKILRHFRFFRREKVEGGKRRERVIEARRSSQPPGATWSKEQRRRDAHCIVCHSCPPPFFSDG